MVIVGWLKKLQNFVTVEIWVNESPRAVLFICLWRAKWEEQVQSAEAANLKAAIRESTPRGVPESCWYCLRLPWGNI